MCHVPETTYKLHQKENGIVLQVLSCVHAKRRFTVSARDAKNRDSIEQFTGDVKLPVFFHVFFFRLQIFRKGVLGVAMQPDDFGYGLACLYVVFASE